MSPGKRGVGVLRFMAGVGAGDGKPALQISRHLRVIDRTGEATIPGAKDAAVPALRGKPHFELNVGVAGRMQLTGDSAEGGETRERHARIGDVERAGDRLRKRDAGVGELQVFEARAIGGKQQRREYSKQKDEPTTDPEQGTTPDFGY